MFRFAADRVPVLLVVMFSMIDFSVYFLVDGVWWLAGYTLIMIIPKGLICAWNHHHQHTMTFHAKPLNRILEFFYALHTGVTTNLWVLHHVLGHHRNFLDQTRDESGWKRADGKAMSALEYTVKIASTAYYRGYQVGKKFPRVQRDFLRYTAITFIGFAPGAAAADSAKWEKLPDMPVEKWEAGTIVLDGLLKMASGFEGFALTVDLFPRIGLGV